MKAMILAAGLGTRLKPFTDFHPKALAMVNGKSLLQRNIEYLQAFGINEVVVNVHHFADQIMEAVKANDGWGSIVVWHWWSGRSNVKSCGIEPHGAATSGDPKWLS